MLDYTIFGESHGPAVGVLVTGAAPVSYTHLDVYKRQAVGSVVLWLTGRKK